MVQRVLFSHLKRRRICGTDLSMHRGLHQLINLIPQLAVNRSDLLEHSAHLNESLNRRIVLDWLSGAFAQHHVGDIDEVVQQHVILDLQVVQAKVCGHFAALHLLQHHLDQAIDLFHVCVHLAQQLHRLWQILLRCVVLQSTGLKEIWNRKGNQN